MNVYLYTNLATGEAWQVRASGLHTADHVMRELYGIPHPELLHIEVRR